MYGGNNLSPISNHGDTCCCFLGVFRCRCSKVSGAGLFVLRLAHHLGSTGFKVFPEVSEMAQQRILAGRKFKNSTGARVDDAGVRFLSPTHRVRSVYCRVECGESCGVVDILES